MSVKGSLGLRSIGSGLSCGSTHISAGLGGETKSRAFRSLGSVSDNSMYIYNYFKVSILLKKKNPRKFVGVHIYKIYITCV